MQKRTSLTLFFVISTWLGLGADLAGQTKLKPGFNLFSPQQDVEIGQKSAEEVEKQMPALKDQRVQQYIRSIGKRLADVTEGPDFPYQFKVINVSDVNAFALPGGFMYVNRGLIEAADSEGELAGVMAHEISHVALRHGTNQASKAYMAQAGLSVLGILLGGGGGSSTGQIIGAIGGFGLNATFLKFGRDAERQADLMGAQILARAGYDPMKMADFFEKLREIQGHDPGKLETFFSSHPPSGDRAENVARETEMLDVNVGRPVGNFGRIRSRLKDMPKAPSMQELASGKSPDSPPAKDPPDSRDGLRIESPSQRMVGYESYDGLFRIWHPSNWEPFEDSQNAGVTIIPKGGVIEKNGQQNILYGVLISRFDPSQAKKPSTSGPFRGRNRLERTSNQLVNSLLRSNPHLKPLPRSRRSLQLDGKPGLTIRLQGYSETAEETESVTLFTCDLGDGTILSCAFVSPAEDLNELKPVFDRMLSSLKLRT